MNKRLILFVVPVSGAALCSCSTRNNVENDVPKPLSRPNIVFILADDMGYGDISGLNPESAIKTPWIDRMCSEGVCFLDAHSCSAVSSPSRYGILTGRYNFRGPIKSSVLGGYSAPTIESSRPTMASVLKSGGYKTGIYGKWHLGLGWQTKSGTGNPSDDNTDFTKPLTYTPVDVGFIESSVLPASLDMCPYVCVTGHNVEDTDIVEETGVYPASYRGHMWRPGKRSRSFDIQNTLQFYTDKSLDFIRRNSSSPFFLYMPLTAPHTPWSPTLNYAGKSGAGDYGDFVMNVDDVVGQVVSLLDSLGILEKTVVVFASDNGADWNTNDKKNYPHLANYVWRGRKSDLWDGGHHIPLVVRYPAAFKKSFKSKALVCLTDLFATFADIAGVDIPKGAAQDSYSLLKVLSGDALSSERTEIVYCSNDGSLGLKQGRWKYLDCSGSGGWSLAHNDALPQCQLYDMISDQGETTNLSQSNAEKAREMKTLLDKVKAE